MIFFFSKTLDLLFSPLTWAILLGLLALLWPDRPRAAFFGGASVVVLTIFSVPAVANALMWAGERGAPNSYRPGQHYDAAIVLGGLYDEDASVTWGRPQFNQHVDRLLAALELYRAGAVQDLLLSGGEVHPRPGGLKEADVLEKELEQFGVPADRLFAEDTSRNTHENALRCVPIVAAHHWQRLLLITSALHMPRALATFRAAGLQPDAFPVDHHSSRVRRGLLAWLPRATALNESAEALHELAGREAYRVLGYSR